MIAYHLNISKGDLFDGKYRIVEQIGGGSYGDVYKVTKLQGEVYALKVLRLWEIMGDLHEGLVRRFEQEYKVMRISSEYLVHSLDFGTLEGNPYILMEYCPKGDFSHFAPNDAPHIAQYACDILRGLYDSRCIMVNQGIDHGNSGGPAFYIQGGAAYVVGIVSRGDSNSQLYNHLVPMLNL